MAKKPCATRRCQPQLCTGSFQPGAGVDSSGCAQRGRGGNCAGGRAALRQQHVGKPSGTGCWLQGRCPGWGSCLATVCCRAAPSHKGAVMRHPPGTCALTWPGLDILSSGTAKASWAELPVRITRLLLELLVWLPLSKHFSFPADCSSASTLFQR